MVTNLNFSCSNSACFIKEPDENEKDDPNSRSKRKAIKSSHYRWTDKTIPYKIASGTFTGTETTKIRAAIAEWNRYTCLRLRESTSNDNNRIYFDNGRGCYSYVGMVGKSQTVGLARGCRHKGVIVHEIGHAVGFHHEQNRPDRDDHVTIVRANIPSNLYYNFKKYPWSSVDTLGVPYDYGSVMHYGGKAFSTNGQYTIRTKDPRDQTKIGNRQGLSFYDIKLANLMYKCQDECRNKPTKACPSIGFLGKDCKCWCPGNPIKECEGGEERTTRKPGTTKRPGQTTTQPPSKCRDFNQHCGAWATSGYCNINTYVTTYCKKSCNSCTGISTNKGKCQNIRSDRVCQIFFERGYCTGIYAEFMVQNCAKMCKTCTPNDPGSGANSLMASLTLTVAVILLASRRLS